MLHKKQVWLDIEDLGDDAVIAVNYSLVHSSGLSDYIISFRVSAVCGAYNQRDAGSYIYWLDKGLFVSLGKSQHPKSTMYMYIYLFCILHAFLAIAYLSVVLRWWYLMSVHFADQNFPTNF
jgi:hypothetical protein